MYKTILEKAHFLNAGEKLTKVLKDIGDEVGKRKLPPDVEAPFVKSLLEEHICICGREIAFESEEEAHLQHLLKEKEPEQGTEILTYLQGPVRIIQDSLVDWKNGIALIKANLEDAIRDATDLSAKLDAISDLEKGLNDAEKELKEKYESAYRRKYEIMGELELEKNRKEQTGKELSDAGKRINEINEKIFKESEIGKDVVDAKNNYQIADLIQKALLQIPEDLFKTYAFRLQEKINDVLGSINVVSQFTTKVSYSERGLSFAFKELSPEFEELGAYMSGGQNQLVGICMMASFISVLGEIGRNVVEPPMVFMDHPISNLSDKGKALFQEKLTGIFKGIQLIVIATDGEVTGFLEHCGRENISKVFKVEHDKSRKLSQKMEVE